MSRRTKPLPAGVRVNPTPTDDPETCPECGDDLGTAAEWGSFCHTGTPSGSISAYVYLGCGACSATIVTIPADTFLATFCVGDLMGDVLAEFRS